MSEYTKRAREFAHKAAEHAADLDADTRFVAGGSWPHQGSKPLRQVVGDLVDALHLLAEEIERLDRENDWVVETIHGLAGTTP